MVTNQAVNFVHDLLVLVCVEACYRWVHGHVGGPNEEACGTDVVSVPRFLAIGVRLPARR